MSIVFIVAGVLVGLLGFVALLSGIAPTRVEYTESIEIAAPADQVWDDIRFQKRLMRWSAWPKETGSQCAVVPGPSGQDGTVGTRTLFISKGKSVGHQEILSLEDQREIIMSLEGPGPPHQPTLRFVVEPIDGERTRVDLHFVNEFARPFNVPWRFLGLSNWTRRMHVKDLEGLKAFSEPPHRDADGRAVGRELVLPNPYEVEWPIDTGRPIGQEQAVR